MVRADRICSLTPVYEYTMQESVVRCFTATLWRTERSDSIIKSNINLRRGIAPSRRASTEQYVVRDKVPEPLARTNGAIRSQIRVTDRCTRRNNIIPGAGIYHTPPPLRPQGHANYASQVISHPVSSPDCIFMRFCLPTKGLIVFGIRSKIGVFSLVNKDVNKAEPYYRTNSFSWSETTIEKDTLQCLGLFTAVKRL